MAKKYNCFNCKQCGRTLTRLSTKDDDGNSGNVLVDYGGLTSTERQSINMGISVPYDETIHKKLIHFLRCNNSIPRCNTCNMLLAFFKTQPNPERNGHNNPGNMPMDFYKITKEERYRFILGLPVQFNGFMHQDIIHFANKECADLPRKKRKKMKEKANG